VALSLAGRFVIRCMHKQCRLLTKFEIKVSPSDYLLLKDISQFLERYDPKLSTSMLDSSTMSEKSEDLLGLQLTKQQLSDVANMFLTDVQAQQASEQQ
jgi:hypothetical protein